MCLVSENFTEMDFILLSIFIVTALAVFWPFIKKIKKQIEFQNILNKVPGPKSFPLFGTTLPFIMTPREG